MAKLLTRMRPRVKANLLCLKQGIEPLLDNLFSFLRRKTDFFVGASPEMIEETVLGVIRKHADIAAKDKAEKERKLTKEKEDKLKKQRAAEKKKVYMTTSYHSFALHTVVFIPLASIV